MTLAKHLRATDAVYPSQRAMLVMYLEHLAINVYIAMLTTNLNYTAKQPDTATSSDPDRASYVVLPGHQQSAAARPSQARRRLQSRKQPKVMVLARHDRNRPRRTRACRYRSA